MATDIVYIRIARGSHGQIFSPTFPDLTTFPPSNLVAKVGTEQNTKDEYRHAQWLITHVEDAPMPIPGTPFLSYPNGVYALDVCPLDERLYNRFIRPSHALKQNPLSLLERLLSAADNSSDQAPIFNCDGEKRFLAHLERADGDMSAFIAQIDTPYRAQLCLILLLQPLTFLARMHEKEFFHFDIKPENILYFRPGKDPPKAKLCDFAMLGSPRLQADFTHLAPFTQPWYNYPPWASLFYHEMLKRDLKLTPEELKLDELKLEDTIIDYFRKPLHASFQLHCIDPLIYRFRPHWGAYPDLPFNIVSFASAIDLYGMAMLLDNIRAKLVDCHFLTPSLNSKIVYFCERAATMQLDINCAITLWRQIALDESFTIPK